MSSPAWTTLACCCRTQLVCPTFAGGGSSPLRQSGECPPPSCLVPGNPAAHAGPGSWGLGRIRPSCHRPRRCKPCAPAVYRPGILWPGHPLWASLLVLRVLFVPRRRCLPTSRHLAQFPPVSKRFANPWPRGLRWPRWRRRSCALALRSLAPLGPLQEAGRVPLASQKR